MLTVIIPTLNEERRLPPTLAALVPATIDGVVQQVVIADGGSTDKTIAIAEDAGADVVARSVAGRGSQLASGVTIARAPWLLFLHADTCLASGWHEEVATFIRDVETRRRPEAAAVFTFALDDRNWRARLLERGVAFRSRAFALPYGDQGLLISRALYDSIGGMKPIPLLEDVDIIRRLGRKRVVILQARAMTSADRYRQDGYSRRSLTNWSCLAQYFLGVPPERIARRYNRQA
jgi:rSAM/selenodomain-associated transferase 2